VGVICLNGIQGGVIVVITGYMFIVKNASQNGGGGTMSEEQGVRRRYSVALWVRWPALFADVVAQITEEDAVTAVEMVMRIQEWQQAVYVAVGACDGSCREVLRLVGVELAGDGLSVCQVF
jgi:hypothetical protein